MPLSEKLYTRYGRVAEVLLGAVFLAGALLKAKDINLFIVQVSYYGVVDSYFGFDRNTLLNLSALGTLFVETALGTALVLGCRLQGVTYAALWTLLAVFTGLIAYAWAYHDLQDCGCFGPIEMSPAVSIAKNGLLALLGVLAWRAHRKNRTRPARRTWLAAQLLLCAVLGLATTGCAYSRIETIETERPFAQFVFEADGLQWDLGEGVYFVAMLSTSCEHCMASVEQLNILAETPGFPPVIGLCYEEGEKGSLETFRDMAGAIFPLNSLRDRVRTFFELIGEAPPRFIYVRDGKSIAYWDDAVPETDDVLGL